MTREVLFKRNDSPYESRDKAIEAIPSLVSGHGKDGSQLHVRYTLGDDVRTILVAVGPDGNYTYYEQHEPLDEAPTEDSVNGVTSGGVYDALKDKVEFEVYPDFASLPKEGSGNIIYVNNETGQSYRWDTDGKSYVPLSTMAINTIICDEAGTQVSTYECTPRSMLERYRDYMEIPTLTVFDDRWNVIGQSVFSNIKFDGNIAQLVFEYDKRWLYTVTIDPTEGEDGSITIEKGERYSGGHGITVEDGVIASKIEYQHIYDEDWYTAFTNHDMRSADLKYRKIYCGIADKTLRYFDASYYTPTKIGSYLTVKARYTKDERTDTDLYVPFVGFTSTKGLGRVDVDIVVDGNRYETHASMSYDTPENWTFAFVKSVPFDIVVKGDRNRSVQMWSFLVIPANFVGTIEYTPHDYFGDPYKFFTVENGAIGSATDVDANSQPLSLLGLPGIKELPDFLYDMEVGSNDSCGFLDVDFFVDGPDELQVEDGKCPDWVVNDFILHNLQLKLLMESMRSSATAEMVGEIAESVEGKQEKLPGIPEADGIHLYPVKFDSQGHIVDYGQPKLDGTWSESFLDDTDLNWIMGLEVEPGANYVYIDAPGLSAFHYELNGSVLSTTDKDDRGYFYVNIRDGEFGLTHGLDQLDVDSVRGVYRSTGETVYESAIK